MNKNAQMWVKALRSGQFKQDRCRLQTKNGYCCLGVACEVFEACTGRILPRNEKGILNDKVLARRFSIVQEWLGLKSPSGSFVDKNDLRSLTWLNDTGAPFWKIADIIEANQRELFHEEEKTHMPLARMSSSYTTESMGLSNALENVAEVS